MANEATQGDGPRGEPVQIGPGRAVASLGGAKLLFLLAAGLSFLLSVALWFGGDRERGLFVGLWVPSILAAGALLHAGEARRRE